MTALGGLVDLSLFATSPTDDRNFGLPNRTSSERIFREIPCHRAQREVSCPLPRGGTMKPLPPLPASKLCRRRAARGRHDPNSRCILVRMKRIGLDDRPGNESSTLQQRRNVTTIPRLTLSVPPSAPHPQPLGEERRQPRPSMIWMPDEQMWLIQDQSEEDSIPGFWAYPSLPLASEHRYTRSEPSPDSTARFDLSPLSPVRSQFLRLMDCSDRERLSPLFQEAVQTVPMMDLSPIVSPPTATPMDEPEQEEDWLSDSSGHQSYHTPKTYCSIASPTATMTTEEPRIIFPQLAWEGAWEGGGAGRRAPNEQPRIVFPQLAWEGSWEGVGRMVTRPASAMN